MESLMIRAEGLCVYIKKIDAELKRVAEHTKGLRESRKTAQLQLYEYMGVLEIDELSGYKRKNLQPPPKIPAEVRRESTVRFLDQKGIENPEEFYEMIRRTQTKAYILKQNNPSSRGFDSDSDDAADENVVYLNVDDE